MFNIRTLKQLADKTPSDRNRYVDFLRAVSIICVVLGHWLIVGAHYINDEFVPANVLNYNDTAHWLTWIFQVMPIFFIVGGYSNATSIAKSLARNETYAYWLESRLQRLFTPLLVIVMVWFSLSLILPITGMTTAQIFYASKSALVPAWFLAIYCLVTLLAPVSYKIWRTFGWLSWVPLVAFSIICDWLFIAHNQEWAGWLNYFWVWLAVHHLGFAWRDNKLPAKPIIMCMAILAAVVLYALTVHGPYPIAMAGSPSDTLSNSLPPKITLLILGVAQFSLLILAQEKLNDWLNNPKPWLITIFINSMIMSIYLWHMTVLLAIFGVLALLDGMGLHSTPASFSWWLYRPLWIIALSIILLPLAAIVAPFERLNQPSDNPTAALLIIAALLSGLGIALVTINGFSGEVSDYFSWLITGLIASGAFLAGVRFRIRSQDATVKT